MDLNLVKDVYNLHIKGFEGLDFNIIRKNNYEIAYNPNINDCFSNFISNFEVNSQDEFENIMNDAGEFLTRVNRAKTIYLIPFMRRLYKNREKYFEEEKYELISTEAWQIYTDFTKLNYMNSKCDFDITLELATNMEEYANCVMDCYQTDDEDDPYGNLDDGYRQSYMNYKRIYNDIESEFYFIKANGKIVGTTQSIYNDKLYGIYSLAIKKEYRNKGIGKEVLKKQLQMCKLKNIPVAYLQTELGFYPNKMYKKFGFQDLCTVYYYSKK